MQALVSDVMFQTYCIELYGKVLSTVHAQLCLLPAGVTIQTYKVIYNLLDDMRDAMEGKLTALEQRVPVGAAEVRAVFGKGSKLVAGCMVTEGLLRDDSFIVVSGACSWICIPQVRYRGCSYHAYRLGLFFVVSHCLNGACHAVNVEAVSKNECKMLVYSAEFIVQPVPIWQCLKMQCCFACCGVLTQYI